LIVFQVIQFLSDMISRFAERHLDVSVPSDYLHLSLKGMKKLKQSKCINVLYELSKGLGITRPDGSDSTFPTKRMPMRLLQYMVSFFNSGAGQVSNYSPIPRPSYYYSREYQATICVKCLCVHSRNLVLGFMLEDYRSWLQTMYVLFGSKCIKLFCGPMWSSEPTEQGSASVDNCRDPVRFIY
jgi:hypothetical protein